MVDFYNDEFKILLCTTIVESGLDLSKTNTMIVHNSDKFGLSQLYQLRGRIGRANIEAYCYYTISDFNSITETANQRLNLLKKLDSRGSSFNLASHDLEVRGSGNIIGDQQSGHIKEIGLELYHRLLKEKIIELRSDFHTLDAEWSPQINLGLNVLIPEQFIPNLNTRLYFYRKLAYLSNIGELKEIKNEMLERFGSIPDEVFHLFKITELRVLCKDLSIEKFDLGARGLTIKFRNNKFEKSDELVALISRKKYDLKLRSDQTLVYNFNKTGEKQRISKAFHFMKELTTL
jgi:transcription-repair coupling factor (superfamily II helicase)